MVEDQKFARLTLVRRIKGRLFEFLCDCGTSVTTSIYDVRRGATKSCGCMRREASSAQGKRMTGRNVRDLTGQRFGLLTVRERGPNTKHQTASWLCVCDCGGEKLVSGNHLVAGNTASCGCAYRLGLAVRPDEKRAKSNEYVQRRMREDLRYALNRRAQQLVHASLRARGAEKSRRWEDLVGYTLADLRAHLERLIPEGYSWADFIAGRLHIDHRTPLAAFNFEREGDLDFQRAWALENLQLLPAAENVIKGDRLDEPFQPSLKF